MLESLFNKVAGLQQNRSSRLQMFFKLGALKNFANFTGKHLCWSLFLIKFLRNFIKDIPTQVCWSVKFAKFLRTSFFYRLPAVAASEWTLPSIERLCNNKNQHDFLLISCVF